MIVYVDVVFLINILFDFAILATADIILKRNAKMKRILLGAFLGELSMLTLFINIGGILLTTFKILLTIIMCLGAFGYKNFKYTVYNIIYVYLIGIILGGFVYYLYNEFKVGTSYSIKVLIILLLSPLILIVYYHLSKKLKMDYNNRHCIKILYEDKVFEGVGYLDSGNKLISPISGKPIILVEKEYITLHKLKLLPVPYNALNHHGIVLCFKPNQILIDDKEYKDILIGISDVKFHIEGCNVLLNARIEGI